MLTRFKFRPFAALLALAALLLVIAIPFVVFAQDVPPAPAPDAQALITALQAHEWPLAIAIALFGLIAIAKQGWFGAYLQKMLPPRWLPFIAPALSAIGLGLGEFFRGTPWPTALLQGLEAGVGSVFLHQTLVEGIRGGREIVPATSGSASGGGTASGPSVPPASLVSKPTVISSKPPPPAAARWGVRFEDSRTGPRWLPFGSSWWTGNREHAEAACDEQRRCPAPFTAGYHVAPFAALALLLPLATTQIGCLAANPIVPVTPQNSAEIASCSQDATIHNWAVVAGSILGGGAGALGTIASQESSVNTQKDLGYAVLGAGALGATAAVIAGIEAANYTTGGCAPLTGPLPVAKPKPAQASNSRFVYERFGEQP
jgi:hypothetical protein